MPHTPGPWRAVHRCVGAQYNDNSIAGLGWEIDGPPEPELRGQFAKAADAHLIAAAPDLYEACVFILAILDDGVYYTDAQAETIIEGWIGRTRIALRKAEGA